MKRILLSLVAIATISLSSFGQSPEGFKYQAVVRDAVNAILSNQAVGMRLTINKELLEELRFIQRRLRLPLTPMD